MLAFPIILTLAIVGSFGAPWWIALAGAAALTLVAISDREGLGARFALAGHSDIFSVGLALSFTSSFIASTSALLLGRFAAWLS